MRRTIFELVLVRFVGVGLLIKVGSVDVWVENSMGNITSGAQKRPIGKCGFGQRIEWLKQCQKYGKISLFENETRRSQ